MAENRNAATTAMRKWLLLPLPLLLIGAGLLMDSARGPSYLAQHMEPEYAYLFSSLNLAEGKPAKYADHPGMTVQLLGAAGLRLRHPLDSQARAEDALKNPEKYIKTAGLALTLAAAAGMFLAGLIVLSATESLGAALAFQAVPFLSPTTLGFALNRFSPEPLLLALTLPFCALLLARARPRTLGIIAALGFATKLTFGPVALLPFFVFNNRKEMLAYCAWTAGTFILLTLPMAPMYPEFAEWSWQLLSGKGFYGQHGFGFAQPGHFLPSIARIADAETAYILLLALLALVLIRARLSGSGGGEKKLALGLLAAGMLGILLSAKLFSPRYLIPCACSASAAAVLPYRRSETFSLPVLPRTHRQVIMILLAIYAMVSLWGFALELRFRTLSQRAQLEFAQAAQTALAGYPKAYYYPVSSQLMALFDGDIYGGGNRGELLEKLYPLKNIWFVHRFRPELWTWTGPADTEALLKNQELLFIGNSRIRPSPLPGLELEPVLRSSSMNDETASAFRRI
ncbi:MAG: hypothetical protein GX410_00135 [Elusimicrobia bacterium]|nr:hypothetical protein [Elusimicrobiota bacterium]